MPEARGEVVEKLCKGAVQGMLDAGADQDINKSDVFSAFMTMALRQIIYARDHGGNIVAIRQAIQDLWAELPAEAAH